MSQFTVQVSATVQTSPARIVLVWPADSQASSYALYRKGLADASWGPVLATLSGNASNYTDVNVQAGEAWEYQLEKTFSFYKVPGYICAGITVPLVESRGSVVLVVDNTQTASLASELARLQQDLAGDGWTVIRHDVPRMAVDPAETSSGVWTARSNELASVKALIKADYENDPLNVRAVFLIGHIPVPYSGFLAPDAHGTHNGAWPADVFYGDMNGDWADTGVNAPFASDHRNWNVPGDGKFDPSTLPASVQLQVGRVDFANLPSFSVSETELLRRYLNKDHAFRHKVIMSERRGLIDDHLGLSTGEALAVNGWRNFAPLFGAANIVSGDWLTTLSSQSYLWGYGCGAGTYTSCSGVASTSQLATSDPRVVFTMFFGSYFGDWDSQDNLLRACIATTNYTLTSAWAGRPTWVCHSMGLGRTIGFSALLTQTNSDLYNANVWERGVHIALMGDPTLRMRVVGPPSGLLAVSDPGGVKLTWNPSTDTVLGYHVYRSTNAAGPFTRLNTSLITDTNYLDAEVGTNVYMVRAVKLEVSGSGSYYNASQGIFQSFEPSANTSPIAGADTIERDPTNSVKVSIATLLSNDTDADGDPITFLGVSATSVNGGTVVSNSNWIFYTPAVGWTDTDTFTYTISDGRGAPVMGTVTVTVRYDSGPSPNLVITHQGGSSYRVHGDGIPNRTYRVQYAEDVDHPDWQTLGPATADANGVFEIVDTAGSPQRFYRSVYP